MQCAAVSTFVGATTTPPQNWPARVSPNRSLLERATTQGLSAAGAGSPPTTTRSAAAGTGETSGSTAPAAIVASPPVSTRAIGRRIQGS